MARRTAPPPPPADFEENIVDIDVADEMAAAKLTYLGSATLLDNQLELVLTDRRDHFFDLIG